MKLILMCQNCGTARELGENKQYNEIESYQISNNSNFQFNISASIDGIDDVQEM